MNPSNFKKRIIDIGIDTSGRTWDVISILKLLPHTGKRILDAGCGERGLKNGFKSGDFVSTDITLFSERLDDQTFLCSDITQLPFADNSFAIGASVDVIEHLPLPIREKALVELVRVSNKGLVIAFPCGMSARKTDEAYHAALSSYQQDFPEWLTEHLANPYPILEDTICTIERESAKKKKKINRIEAFYSEHIRVTQALRWAATKSKFLYIAFNLGLGIFSRILPKPNASNSYRAILLVEFED